MEYIIQVQCKFCQADFSIFLRNLEMSELLYMTFIQTCKIENPGINFLTCFFIIIPYLKRWTQARI